MKSEVRIPARRGVLRGIVDGLSDVLFPPNCVHCGEVVDPNAGDFRSLCPTCAALIDLVQPPHCTTCGHPFFGVVEGERICPHCDGLLPEFAEGRTATLFRGPVRSLIIELKYHRGLHVLHDVAVILGRNPYVLEFVRGATLVPVPLHPRKARERGYNQAELLARAFADAAGGGTRVELLLRRKVDTATQTAFDRRTRMGNLKNAFALAPGASINPDSCYILVDDVFTTGSTLNSCAHALRRAGVVSLGVATFGHG